MTNEEENKDVRTISELLNSIKVSLLIADTIDRNAKFFRQEFKYNLNKAVKSCEEVMSRFYGKHREKTQNSDCFVINDELQNVIDIYEKAVKTAFALEYKSEEQQKRFIAEWCELIDKHGL